MDNNGLLRQFFTEWYIKWGDREVGFEDACNINQRDEYNEIPPLSHLKYNGYIQYENSLIKTPVIITPKAIKLITGEK